LRVALFSDVHGNAVPFDAFLADLDRQEVDHVVCLGDHAQGGPQPEESVRADTYAEYAVLTVDGPGVGVEFRRVPFDAAA
jgi:predicted phosphodiesterase